MTRILNNLPEILALIVAVVVLVAGLHFLAPYLPFYLLVPGSILFAVFAFFSSLNLLCLLVIWLMKFLLER